MKTNTSKNITEFLKQNKETTAKDIALYLNISPRATFKQLATLLKKGEISKTGTPPKVFYYLNLRVTEKERANPPYDIVVFLDENFIIITPSGEIKEGWVGFDYWTDRTNQPFLKTATDYINTLNKYNKFKGKYGLINGKTKLSNTFSESYLDEIYYVDFYSIERFGRTKLGNLLLYAKQSQDRNLIKRVYEIVKKPIFDLISSEKIDAIAFIPPTVQRKVQFQKELENLLNIPLPTIVLDKIKNEVPVPQKTLNKLEDRIENASKTIFVNGDKVYKNILIIDDAVGSGATLNETARKIKEKGLCTGKIIGIAITGSFKGFDVLNEV